MDNNKIATNAVQYIVVNLGDEQYGIDIKYVDNIVRMQKITRVPKTQSFFVGVINLRGEIIPVMSLRKRFGLEDDVREVVTLSDDQIEKVYSDGKEDKAKFLSSVGKNTDGSLISLLNVNGVIDVN